MTADIYEALALDLVRRTDAAVQDICAMAVDTGIHFTIDDIVQKVEDDLPANYPMPLLEGAVGRRQMIARMARDVLNGDLYEGNER